MALLGTGAAGVDTRCMTGSDGRRPESCNRDQLPRR